MHGCQMMCSGLLDFDILEITYLGDEKSLTPEKCFFRKNPAKCTQALRAANQLLFSYLLFVARCFTVTQVHELQFDNLE